MFSVMRSVIRVINKICHIPPAVSALKTPCVAVPHKLFGSPFITGSALKSDDECQHRSHHRLTNQRSARRWSVREAANQSARCQNKGGSRQTRWSLNATLFMCAWCLFKESRVSGPPHPSRIKANGNPAVSAHSNDRRVGEKKGGGCFKW